MAEQDIHAKRKPTKPSRAPVCVLVNDSERSIRFDGFSISFRTIVCQHCFDERSKRRKHDIFNSARRSPFYWPCVRSFAFSRKRTSRGQKCLIFCPRKLTYPGTYREFESNPTFNPARFPVLAIPKRINKNNKNTASRQLI